MTIKFLGLFVLTFTIFTAAQRTCPPIVPEPTQPARTKRQLDKNKDGSSFLWVIEDTYAGKTFFDGFDFFAERDPTNGSVEYVNQTVAYANGLAYVTDDDHVFMKGDQWSWLDWGVNRQSVRIESKKHYTTGLFILDLNKAPWGCAIWPAFWTVGMPKSTWPCLGEIDIIEGVHDNSHNQVAWHTAPGCLLTDKPAVNFTGTKVHSNDCDAFINHNAGCGITDWSRASYGPFFEAQGGGIFAMKWDENSIAVWNFYRAAIPRDITTGTPNPDQWGTPSAMLDSAGCNIPRFFANHSIVFDITFCGDWAGNSYATSGCPGTCPERLRDPRNFENATWDINTLKVYRKQLFSGGVVGSHNGVGRASHFGWAWLLSLWLFAGP